MKRTQTSLCMIFLRLILGSVHFFAWNNLGHMVALSDQNLAHGAGVYREDKSASSDFQKELQKHCK